MRTRLWKFFGISVPRIDLVGGLQQRGGEGMIDALEAQRRAVASSRRPLISCALQPRAQQPRAEALAGLEQLDDREGEIRACPCPSPRASAGPPPRARRPSSRPAGSDSAVTGSCRSRRSAARRMAPPFWRKRAQHFRAETALQLSAEALGARAIRLHALGRRHDVAGLFFADRLQRLAPDFLAAGGALRALGLRARAPPARKTRPPPWRARCSAWSPHRPPRCARPPGYSARTAARAAVKGSSGGVISRPGFSISAGTETTFSCVSEASEAKTSSVSRDASE